MPCETTRHGCSLWCLYPHYPFSIHIFYLVMNIEKHHFKTSNIGQFQFCINLLPLEFIWRSASCPRHWNQRWFGDAAFTIPSGKQWDHMSPWAPSWLSAGIDKCFRSANESGHHWLKNSWLETIWHKISKMNSGATFSTISSSAIVRMQKKTQFLFTEEKTFWLPMTRRSGCWGCRSGYFRFMLDRQHEPKGHGKCCKYSKSYNV